MSLLIWLPLNGNLNNQGLNGNLEFNAINTLTFNNDGKIGKSYQRATNNTLVTTGININSNLLDLLGTEASVAVWVKPLGTHTHYNGTLLSSGNWNAKRWAFGVNQDNTKVDVLCGGHNTYIDCSVPVNQWTHLCSTFNNGISKLYKNGVYIGQLTGRSNFDSDATNTCIGRETYASGYFGFNGLINDMRIYNHVLSDKEVEEISKGLVLHYQLNNNTNILTQYDKLIYTEPDNSLWLHIARHNNPGSSGYFTKDSSWETGVYIDGNRWYDVAIVDLLNNFEFMVKLKATSSATETKYRWILSINPLKAVYNDVKPTAVTRITTTGYTDGSYGGLWKMNTSARLCIANATASNWYGAIGSWTAYLNGIPGYPNTTITTGYIDLYVRIDNLFNIIYDSSGYNNNGSLLGAPVISLDTIRYNLSTFFDGNDDGILIEDLELSNIINNLVTYSFWIKPSGENGARSVYFGSYSGISWSIEKTTGNVIRSYWNGSPDTTCTGAVIIDNIWLHVCIVKNGTSDLKVYINGIQKFSSTATLSAKTFPTTYRIGRDTRSGDGTPYHGNMSDFRIYATALTEELVLELYNTSATIDNKGNIYARELVET